MKSIILNDIEYRQCSQAEKIFIAKDGTYIIPSNKKEPNRVRTGNIRTNAYNCPIAVQICTTVNVTSDGITKSLAKVFSVGRLVLDAWRNEVDNELEVYHIDRDPLNNNIDNLKLVTKKENLQHRKAVNPTWLHTEAVVNRREATKKAIKDGTLVKEEPKEVAKYKQDDTLKYKVKFMEVKKKIRKIYSLTDKIVKLKEKRERWNESSRNYENYTNRINKIQEEIDSI